MKISIQAHDQSVLIQFKNEDFSQEVEVRLSLSETRSLCESLSTALGMTTPLSEASETEWKKAVTSLHERISRLERIPNQDLFPAY